MARADTRTLLPLDTYAKIMGLNPLHFNGARLPDVSPEPFTTGNENLSADNRYIVEGRTIWQQFNWQNPGDVSREDLARLIADAEFEIKEYIGYPVAPEWVEEEFHPYPRYMRTDFTGTGINAHGQAKQIHLRNGKVIAGGTRLATLIDSPSVAGGEMVFSDPNSNGWDTTVTLTFATTVTNNYELKAYFANKEADPSWEIRPAKSVSISGGIATMVFDSWLMFDPDVTDAIPTEITAINASTASNYVNTVDVYQVTNSPITEYVTFMWERSGFSTILPTSCTSCGGAGCTACSLVTQTGCFSIQDAETGMVAPVPASYSTTNARWEKTSWTECREPDSVKVSYYAGNLPTYRFATSETLDSVLAKNVAVLATARLPYGQDGHSTGPLAGLARYYGRDMTESGNQVNTIFIPPQIQTNPFGTKRGEVIVFKNLKNFRKRVLRVSATAA